MSCAHCEVYVLDESYLKQHQRFHKGEIHYVCTKCSYKISQRIIQRHIKIAQRRFYNTYVYLTTRL